MPGSESSLRVCVLCRIPWLWGFSVIPGATLIHEHTTIESCTFDFRPTSLKTWPVTGKLSFLGSMEFRVGVESGQRR